MIATIPELVHNIRSFSDSDYSNFTGWLSTQIEVNNKWADLADMLLINVVPMSTTAVPARAAFLSALSPWAANGAGLPILQNAFMAYAAVIAAGMLPTFAGTPPPSPPVFPMTGLVTKSAAIEAQNIATTLFAWAHTGLATNISSSAVIPWL